MKIAVISDTHFGFALNTERENESYIQGAEAIAKALSLKADVILLAGDIFDSRTPSHEVLAKAAEILQKPLNAENHGVKLLGTIGKEEQEISKISLRGTPVISIYGTHERRGKGLTNPIQLLEKAGMLINLHCSTVVLDIRGKKLAVHGMSGVPENFARVVLEKWATKPVPSAFNIFMFHQNVSQYVYSEEEDSVLKIEDLPIGFDLYIDGHIHWNEITNYKNSKFIFPGSTISTQLRKIEAERQKGFYMLEISDEETETNFITLETQRQLYYKTLEFADSEPRAIEEKIEGELSNIKPQTSNLKPLVRLILKGTLKKGFSASDINIARIEKNFRERLTLSFGREIVSKEIKDNSQMLEDFRKKQLSVDELGCEILRKHLADMQCHLEKNAEELLNMLAEGQVDSAYDLVRNIHDNKTKT